MPEISIVMPVYNVEKYLLLSVEKILKQSFSDFELILVNDGSTDGSGEVCDKCAQMDSRIRVIHQKNAGAGAARNAGIDSARGKYIVFPDGDDYYCENTLEELHKAISETNSDVVICGYQCMNEEEKLLEKVTYPGKTYETKEEVQAFIAKEYPEGFVGFPWNKIYSLDLIREHDIRYPDMRRYQDGVFNLSFFSNVKKCTVIDKSLYLYRINTISKVFVKFPKNLMELIHQMYDSYSNFIEEAGISASQNEENMLKFVLISVVGSIDASFSPNWNYSAKERRQYIEKVMSDELVKKSLQKKEKCSKYVQLMAFFIKHHMVTATYFSGRMKIFIKKLCLA